MSSTGQAGRRAGSQLVRKIAPLARLGSGWCWPWTGSAISFGQVSLGSGTTNSQGSTGTRPNIIWPQHKSGSHRHCKVDYWHIMHLYKSLKSVSHGLPHPQCDCSHFPSVCNNVHPCLTGEAARRGAPAESLGPAWQSWVESGGVNTSVRDSWGNMEILWHPGPLTSHRVWRTRKRY